MCVHLSSFGQFITTVAGNGQIGNTGDNGPATDALIGSPGLIAFDDSNNYYFAQPPVIRKVSSSGIITRVAGNGTTGYNGDSIFALSAQLNLPEPAYHSGSLYIADQGNHRIRKIDLATSVITTIGGTGMPGFSGDGGLAVNAMINSPASITFDTSGNLYFVDGNNIRIRKIDHSGIITTIAGNGSSGYGGDNGPAVLAELWLGGGIRIDKYNNLYIASLQKVRKVNLSTNIITTVAGNGSIGYSGDGGLAELAELWFALDVLPDNSGNIYISESSNNVIRKVNSNGIITTIVGTGVSGYNGDGGLADTSKLNSPRGIALDSCNNLYISDNSNHRIRKVTFNPNCFPERVKEVNKLKDIIIYPNPAQQQLTISSSNAVKQISVLNTIGQVLITQRNYTDKAVVDVSNLSPGLYFIKVSDRNGADAVQRFVKE